MLKKSLHCLLVVIISAILGSTAWADKAGIMDEPGNNISDLQLGKKLVREVWDAILRKDQAKVNSIMAKKFQSVHTDGARNRAEETELINKNQLGEYKLSGFEVTREGKALTVSYVAEVKEEINGIKLSAAPAMRMSIFYNTDQGWKWIAHTNFKAIKYKTADSLKLFVEQVASLIEREGEKAFKLLRQNGSKWFLGDRYIFVWGMDGIRYVYPPDPKKEGQKVRDLVDADGKPIGELFLSIASSEAGKGWAHYQWPKPNALVPSWKSTYIMKVTAASGKDYLIGSGAYDLPPQKSFIKDTVDSAVKLLEKEGKMAFATLRDPKGQYIFQDTYVFIIDENGIELLNPAFPKLEGRKVLEYKDADGSYFVKNFIEMAKTKGHGWVKYQWPKPGDVDKTEKLTYISKAILDGKMVVVCAGLYKD